MAVQEQVSLEEKEAYFEWLRGPEGSWCSEIKDLGDGLYAATKPLLFHWALIVGQIGNRYSFIDRWCYADQEKAEAGLRQWDGQGDPEGWHRHPGSGRRRTEGDPAQEHYVP